MINKQNGFTLIELVVVMVILGVLAATALPKFMNVNSQAHEAALAGTGGAFGSAVSIVKSTWIATGQTAAVTNLAGFDNTNIDTNASGWPIAIDGTLNDAGDCVDMWNGIMQNPPSVASSGTSTDYTAAFSGTICTYTYNGTSNMSISYDTSNGNVTVDDDSSS